MEAINQYQMRVRKDLTGSPLHESAKVLGAATVTEIKTFTVTLPSIQAVVEKTAEIEKFKEYEIISIILIDEDNREQLGEDFDWENEADE